MARKINLFREAMKGGAKRLALKLSKQVIWQYSNKNKHLD